MKKLTTLWLLIILMLTFLILQVLTHFKKNYFFTFVKPVVAFNQSHMKEENNKLEIEYPDWLSKCSTVYLDVGSNIGVQVKKLFEPERYEHIKTSRQKKVILNAVLKLYEEAFGLPSQRTQKNSGLCAIGFEPNPRHHQLLNDLEKIYNKKGWKVHFFPYAVSIKNTFVTLYSNERNQLDVAASLFKTTNIKKQFTVKVISLSDFIEIYFKDIQINLVKLDIEGSEYEVLTDMLLKGMLCQSKIKTMYIEFHENILRKSPWFSLYKSSNELIEKVKTQNKCNATNILVIDDESFNFDVE